MPKALREIGNWVAHKARGPTSVALQSRENELSFLVLDDAKFRALVWSFGPSISFVHSGRVLRAELALCALVERNGAGVLTVLRAKALAGSPQNSWIAIAVWGSRVRRPRR